MKDVRAIVEESAKSFATYFPSSTNILFLSQALLPLPEQLTSAIRLIFSLRSFSEKPKSLFSPNRTLSPSNRYAANPKCSRCCSSAVAIVDLPDAERPVNQIVKPRCFRNSLRSWREREACQVMLLFSCQFLLQRGVGGVVFTLPLRGMSAW